MNADATTTPNLRRLLEFWPFVGFVGRTVCTIFLLTAGVAGLAFLFDAQATGPSRIQVNDSVRQYVLGVATKFMRVAAGVAILVELCLPMIVQVGATWRRTLLLLPLLWAIVGAGAVAYLFALEDVEIVQKRLMLMVGGGVVFFLAVSMHATLWQASFDVAPDVTDFPYPWYLVLVMLMAGFFGAFRGWTDVSPIVRGVLDYRKQAWGPERQVNPGKPAEDDWIR